MRNPLTTQVVADGISKLVVAFPGNLAAKTNPVMLADTYRRGLDGLDGDAVTAAIDICIREETYFPKVAKLREVAGEWMRRNRHAFAPTIPQAWNVCPTCGARAVPSASGKRDEMHHDPQMHHVRRGEEGEYEGAA